MVRTTFLSDSHKNSTTVLPRAEKNYFKNKKKTHTYTEQKSGAKRVVNNGNSLNYIILKFIERLFYMH